MNTTDQAFIAAFQQSASSGSAAVSTATPAQRVDLPHSRPRAQAPALATGQRAKAPLSEHLARRRAETVDHPTAEDQPLRPGVEVDALPWPELVVELATRERQSLLDLLSGVTKRLESNEAPAIALVGTRPGVGTTTTLLAIAKLVASVGGRVAIVDASKTGGAASRLGVRRLARIDAASIDDLLVSSRGCGTSVLAVAASNAEPFAAAALKRLVATHDLVLTDAGDANAWLAAAGADRSGVLVVDDDASGDNDARYATATRLDKAGITTTGFVETYAPIG